VLATAGTAFAQSSVTMYGLLDLGMLSNKKTVGTATGVTSFDLAGAQGTRNGNRLGVRGSEDLGGGLSAGFQFETRINPDASAADSLGGGARVGNLSLRGGFGGIVVGTFYNAFDDVRGTSPAVAGVAGGDFFAKTAEKTGLSGRSENALGYRINLGPVNLRASLASRKNQGDLVAPPLPTTTPATTPPAGLLPNGTSTKLNGFGLAAGYDNGPLSTLLAFGTAKVNTIAPSPAAEVAKIVDVAASVSYNLGMAVPYVAIENSKTTTAGGPNFNKTSAVELGAKFPLGAFTPYLSVGSAKVKNNAGQVSKFQAVQLGTTYDLSKRTWVYGALGNDKSTVTSTNVATKNTGYALGLGHRF
jgi:predicted porin